MYADPDNPFSAVPPKGGATPSPFQPAPLNGGKSPFSLGHDSPFKVPSAQPSAPDPRSSEPARVSPSPFSVAKDDQSLAKDDQSRKPAETRLSEPSEGFAIPASKNPTPVPLPGPSDERDSYAAPKAPHSPEHPRRDQETSRSSSAIPTGQNDPASTSLPREESPRQALPAAGTAGSRPSHAKSVHGDTPQLVLRAIFGVTEELKVHEILQLARKLPGVRNLDLAGPAEVEAMALLRKSIRRLDFGDPDSFTFRSDEGEFDLIEDSGAALAILHEGDYAAGVRETLIIVARELARLT